jgi:hypothetical protein
MTVAGYSPNINTYKSSIHRVLIFAYTYANRVRIIPFSNKPMAVHITTFRNVTTFILIDTNVSNKIFASSFRVKVRDKVRRLSVSSTTPLAQHYIPIIRRMFERLIDLNCKIISQTDRQTDRQLFCNYCN